MISLTSARFAHNQKMLENMQHETAVILEQAFAQRGISKDTTGLTDTALEEKLRNLALERQKRIQVTNAESIFVLLKQQYYNICVLQYVCIVMEC